MNCPACGSKSTGKVGVDQFYCWDCCVEFKTTNDQVSIFEVDEEGSLVAYGSQELE